MFEMKLISPGLVTSLLVIIMGWLTAFAPVEMLILTLVTSIFFLSVLYPKICFILLILLTPWSPALTGIMVGVSQGMVGLSLSLFEVIALAAWVAFFVRLPKFKKIDMPKLSIIHLFFVIWLTASAIIGALGGFDFTRLLRNVILFSTLFPFAAFMRSGIVRISQRERVYLQLIVLTMGLGALFMLSPLVGQRYGGVEVTSLLRINRIDLWFNTFIFVYILCMILGEKNVNAFSRLLIAWTALFCILFSLGRSFWLAAFGVVAYVAVMHFKKNKWLIIAGSVLSVFLLLHLGVAQQRFVIGAASLQYRFYEHSIILSEAFKGGFLTSIVGRGLAAPVPEELANFFLAEYVWWIHNEWLLILYNGGLIGVLFYALFLISLIIRTKASLGARLVGLALLLTSIGAGQLLNPISGPWIALTSYSFFSSNRQTKT